MKNKRLALLPVTALLLLLTGSAYAHHGVAAWYDVTKSATVKGTVTKFEWSNPHSYIYVEATNDKGVKENWSAEMGSVGMLARFGWRRDTLKPGDQVTLVGQPARDGKTAILLSKVVLAGGQELPASDLLPGTPVGRPKEN